jgi:hypothetical protein
MDPAKANPVGATTMPACPICKYIQTSPEKHLRQPNGQCWHMQEVEKERLLLHLKLLAADYKRTFMPFELFKRKVAIETQQLGDELLSDLQNGRTPKFNAYVDNSWVARRDGEDYTLLWRTYALECEHTRTNSCDHDFPPLPAPAQQS